MSQEIKSIKDALLHFIVHEGWLSNYLLGTGESYGPTAQHTQDSPIFFIQLNYVHK